MAKFSIAVLNVGNRLPSHSEPARYHSFFAFCAFLWDMSFVILMQFVVNFVTLFIGNQGLGSGSSRYVCRWKTSSSHSIGSWLWKERSWRHHSTRCNSNLRNWTHQSWTQRRIVTMICNIFPRWTVCQRFKRSHNKNQTPKEEEEEKLFLFFYFQFWKVHFIKYRY